MSKIRKPTESYRATVDKQARTVVQAEGSDVDPMANRKIQLLLPSDVQVFMAIDHPSPREMALTRTYDMVQLPFPSSNPVTFKLLATQELHLVAGDKQAFVGVIVEYLE